MLKPKVGFFMLCHPGEEGREEAPSLFQRAILELKKLDLDVVVAEELVEDENSAHRAAQEFRREDVDVICLVEGTWSSDYLALDILEEVNVPIITWGLPGIRKGSLCGVQQLDCVLKELGKAYKFIYGSVEERKPYEKIEGYAKAASLKRILRKARLGLVGYRIKGMTEVTFDELELKSLLGPRIVHFGLNELKSEMNKVHREEAEKVWKEIKNKVEKVNAEEKERINSMRAYLVLKKWIEEEGLSGLCGESRIHAPVCLPTCAPGGTEAP